MDRLNNVYDTNTVFTVQQGSTKETKLNVYPKKATDPAVTYSSSDESICTVDENGVITGVHFGAAIVTARSKEDGSKMAVLNVLVKADTPFAVYLSEKELSLKVSQSHTLTVDVDAPVAVDKSVTYVSDNPDVVSVDANGKLVARSEGTATITVTTVLGEKTDTCTVTVLDGKPPIYLDVENDPDIVKNSSDVYVCTRNVIDIASMLILEEGIDPETVGMKIIAGNDRATLQDGILTLNKKGTVTVKIYVGDESTSTVTAEFKFGLQVD
ncbi:MAG: Ig-like domain-containing protein [Clostridia bacterium]|nr:Ig-like domain-containing protein [Clostridia bacterium]